MLFRSPQGDVKSTSFSSGDQALGLLPAGAYSLRVSGIADDAFAFNLLDLSAAASLTLGTSTTATVALDTASATLYEFSGTAGQVFFLDNTTFWTWGLIASTEFNSWVLFDQYGNQVSTGSLNGSDSGRLTLPSTGTYTLALNGFSPFPQIGRAHV